MNDYERLSNFEHKNERNLLVDKKPRISAIFLRILLHFPDNWIYNASIPGAFSFFFLLLLLSISNVMKSTIFYFLKRGLFILLVTLLFTQLHAQVKIAVSKPYETYEKWLKAADPGVIPVGMYALKIDSALRLLETCSGLLLTGGEDVDPVNYGKLNELNKCEEIDRYRDSLEFALIKKAVELKMPIFGICRGEQILNVYFGGTLYTDIPTDIDTTVTHRCPPGSKECLHNVTIQQNTLLAKITGQKSGAVNSYHHQAVEKVAPGFKITAYSDNKVPEAIETDGTRIKTFVMGVQWHPERLTQNPLLSKPLGDYFLGEVKKYRMKK